MRKLNSSLIFSIFISVASHCFAQSDEAFSQSSISRLALETKASTDILTIGIKEAPPFVIKKRNGEFTGISIELWEAIAKELEFTYQYKETTLKGLIEGLQDRTLDLSVAALTVTEEREKVIDFSHPFHTTGLAIAVPEKGEPVWAVFKRLVSLKFLVSLVALIGLLMLVGFILWLAERKKNAEMFGGAAAKGIGASFWWAAVTMTTVGYGDKAPITFWGRAIGLVWMFTAIIVISSFTAAIATSLTVGQLESSIEGIDDLKRAHVVTVENSVSEQFLADRGIAFDTTASIYGAAKGLGRGEYGAILYDKPILQYTLNQEVPKRTRILPNTFYRQDYAIALQDNSVVREKLNRTLLSILSSPGWQLVLNRHLGAEE